MNNTKPSPQNTNVNLKKSMVDKKIKYLICGIFTLLNVLLCSAAPLKIIKVPSPGNDNDIQPAFQAAVNGAFIGDVIELPEGRFIVNKSVVIKKFLSIRGQGLGKTVLYRSENTSDNLLTNSTEWRGILRFDINSNSSSGIIVSDLTLKSKKPCMVDGDGLSLAADIGIEMIKCVDFVITRCRFENFGNGAVSIVHDDSIVGGLIKKNEFIHNVKGADGLGLGYGVVVYGANKKWLINPRFGSSNFIFVEDNVFDYHRHSIAAGGCALYVFRYNRVLNNTAACSSHAIDAHEARLQSGGNYFSSRAIEVYENIIINKTFKDGSKFCPNGTPIVPGKSVDWLTETAIYTRGGEAIIYENYIEGYRFGVGLVANQILKNAYPIPYQQGYLSALKYGINHTGVDGDKGNGDVFMWNDHYQSYAPKTVYFNNYSDTYLKIERDYHLFAKPGYKAYTYPHPLSGSINTSIEGNAGDGWGKNYFSVYPNPAVNGIINIHANQPLESGINLEMINTSGAIVRKAELVSEFSTFDLNDLAEGVYFIKIYTSKNQYIDKIALIH